MKNFAFVCVVVLQTSQPIGVIWSTVSLLNHTSSWVGLVLKAVNQYLCFHQKLRTALLELAEGRE